jgi:hypothetical protein
MLTLDQLREIEIVVIKGRAVASLLEIKGVRPL